MITKNKKVGDFDNVTIFHISKIEVRTKRVGIESEIAIANNIDEDKSEEAFDDTLQRIDLLIVGNSKSLRWLANLLSEEADKLDNKFANHLNAESVEEENGTNKSDQPNDRPILK